MTDENYFENIEEFNEIFSKKIDKFTYEFVSIIEDFFINQGKILAGIFLTIFFWGFIFTTTMTIKYAPFHGIKIEESLIKYTAKIGEEKKTKRALKKLEKKYGLKISEVRKYELFRIYFEAQKSILLNTFNKSLDRPIKR